MGWSIGFDSNWNRDIGYGVPAICDHPECEKEIDRGLSYVCGSQPHGGNCCGLYFCGDHLAYGEDSDQNTVQMCERCREGKDPFEPKPDAKEWVNWKLTHESWGAWRSENPEWVEANK